MPIVRDRRATTGPSIPVTSRKLFLRHALRPGEYKTTRAFLEHNRRISEQAQALRARARRSDLVVDEHALESFFDQRVGEGVYSGKTFEEWRSRAEAENPRLLMLTLDDVLLDEADALGPERYPDELTVGGARAAAGVPVRPGRGRPRRDPDRAAGRPAAARARGAGLDHPGLAPGVDRGAARRAAQGGAQGAVPAAGAGPRARGRAAAVRRAAAAVARARDLRAHRRAGAARRLGPARGAAVPGPVVPRRRRARQGARGRPRSGRAAAPSASAPASCGPRRRGRATSAPA
ncbi:MAG: DUF3418 domain-containing protein [Myxococcales bacterium]|nr:DUF3418 domain-containing protein [Myxococcales bacterium]